MNDEQFATFLDQLVDGHHPAADDKLARFAQDLQREQGVRRETMSGPTREQIRRSVMQSHVITRTSPSPTNTSTFPDQLLRWQAAVAVMLIVGLTFIGAAWMNRGDSPDPGRDEQIRVAAPTEVPSTWNDGPAIYGQTAGEGSPEAELPSVGDSYWQTPVDPSMCISRPPLDRDQVEAMLANEPAFPKTQIEPITDVTDAESVVAAQTLRAWNACNMGDQPQNGYLSDRFIEETYGSTGESDATRFETFISNGKLVSSAYDEEYEPTDFVVILDDQAFPISEDALYDQTGAYQSGEVTNFQPTHVRQLADGRLVAPMSMTLRESNEFIAETGTWDYPFYRGAAYILVPVDGEWMIDGIAPFCIGECDEMWAEWEIGPTDRGNLDELFADAEVTPVASPTGVDPASINFLSYVDPRTCSATIEHSPMTPFEGTPIPRSSDPLVVEGPVSRTDGLSAAAAMREYITCQQWGFANVTDAFGSRMYGSSQVDDGAPQRVALSLELNDRFSPGRFWVTLPDHPVGNDMVAYGQTYLHSNALQLTDGRVVLPGTWMIPADDPEFIQDPPARFDVNVAIMANVDGRWLLDDTMYVCIGECADYDGTTMHDWSMYTDQQPVATPAASPEALVPNDPGVWLDCPEPDDPIKLAMTSSGNGASSIVYRPDDGSIQSHIFGRSEPPTIPCLSPPPNMPPPGVPELLEDEG